MLGFSRTSSRRFQAKAVNCQSREKPRSPQCYGPTLQCRMNVVNIVSTSASHTMAEEKVASPVNSTGEDDKKPAEGPSPPPDGGLDAWLQVVGGFCLFFNTWGILNAFGVYQVSI